MTLLLPNCVTLKVVETLTSVTFVCYVINKSTIKIILNATISIERSNLAESELQQILFPGSVRESDKN